MQLKLIDYLKLAEKDEDIDIYGFYSLLNIQADREFYEKAARKVIFFIEETEKVKEKLQCPTPS